MKKLVMLKIGVIVEDETVDVQAMDEIGEYIAKDVFGALFNGHDFLDTKYLGCEYL